MKKILVIFLLVLCFCSCNNKENNLTENYEQYEVTFDSCGYGMKVDKIFKTNTLPNKFPILFEDGYKFLGWYLDLEYTMVAKEDTVINCDVTLYAKWEELIPTEGLEYELSEDKSYYRLIYAPEVTDKDVVIPAIYEDKPVKYIAEGFLMGNENIESVVFPSTIEIINDYSFSNCPNLKYLSFGKGLKEIGYGAFGCDGTNKGLETVYFPARNCSFGERYNEETYEGDNAATFPVHTVVYGYYN